MNNKQEHELFNYEPNTTHRFVVKFEEFDIPSFVISKVSNPQLQANVIEEESNGEILKRVGGYYWKNMELEFIDLINPSTTNKIHEMIRELRSRDDVSFKFEVDVLGPVGDVVNNWKVHCVLSKVDFGVYDWNVVEHRKIKMTVKPISVILNF